MLEYLISVSLKGKYLLAQGEALGHKVGFNRSPERASQHPANGKLDISGGVNNNSSPVENVCRL
jgi:hypothetical protein